ncbi:hypothetical protein [Paraburkholderia hospita]|uniref:hypothetical protein n=1 Tax=Paraburkholderia hospita TaxID=169430 RepID=UPI0002719CA8|nr:hypothetical protein [Paraburkholderia hospita]EUC12597.1 hypothetical protein PMI06_008539 [Burkholderia sp. BT03]SKC49085.1 hypothetical protein SAMN06266956_0261 [Paraburkholderia hospita]
MNTKYTGIFIAVAAIMLAACGGGGGSTGSSAATQTTSPPQTTTVGDWIYQGSAPTITGVNGMVAAVFIPDSLTGNGISGSMFNAANTPLTSQVQQANYGGAFTTLSAATGPAISLTKHSTIADVNGVGGYVGIGRWTHGSDSSGGNYTANQGAHYAVGSPLTLTTSAGSLSCTNLMATSPSSATGSVAPGSLVSATATLDLTTLSLVNFNATVTIGSDTAATITKASAMAAGTSMGGGVTTASQPMGNDITKPLLAVAYGAHLPNTGDVNGLVVLACQ